MMLQRGSSAARTQGCHPGFHRSLPVEEVSRLIYCETHAHKAHTAMKHPVKPQAETPLPPLPQYSYVSPVAEASDLRTATRRKQFPLCHKSSDHII